MNEVYAFHGTQVRFALSIAENVSWLQPGTCVLFVASRARPSSRFVPRTVASMKNDGFPVHPDKAAVALIPSFLALGNLGRNMTSWRQLHSGLQNRSRWFQHWNAVWPRGIPWRVYQQGMAQNERPVVPQKICCIRPMNMQRMSLEGIMCFGHKFSRSILRRVQVKMRR